MNRCNKSTVEIRISESDLSAEKPQIEKKVYSGRYNQPTAESKP